MAMSQTINLSPAGLLVAIAAGCALHLSFLIMNMTAVAVLRLGGDDPVERRRTRQVCGHGRVCYEGGREPLQSRGESGLLGLQSGQHGRSAIRAVWIVCNEGGMEGPQ